VCGWKLKSKLAGGGGSLCPNHDAMILDELVLRAVLIGTAVAFLGGKRILGTWNGVQDFGYWYMSHTYLLSFTMSMLVSLLRPSVLRMYNGDNLLCAFFMDYQTLASKVC
jgi:hypothetical protein